MTTNPILCNDPNCSFRLSSPSMKWSELVSRAPSPSGSSTAMPPIPRGCTALSPHLRTTLASSRPQITTRRFSSTTGKGFLSGLWWALRAAVFNQSIQVSVSVFLFSEMCGDLDNLELGDTVEYTLSKGKGNKVSAEKVTKVAPGTRSFISFIQINKCLEIKCMLNPHFSTSSEWHWWRCWCNSDDGESHPSLTQCGSLPDRISRAYWSHRGRFVPHHCGTNRPARGWRWCQPSFLVVSGGSKGQNYPFGIMGMVNKADCLQKGELVKFQVCTVAQTGQKMACNVVPQRRAMVECVKDQVGTA